MAKKIKESQVGQKKILKYTFIAFLVLISVSLLLMPISNGTEESNRILTICAGLFFWLGLMGTLTMALVINRNRKIDKKFKKEFPKLKQLGIIHFFQNKYACIADVAMFISLVGFLISELWINVLFVSFFFLAVFVFSFGMHCMLNGINYKYLNY